MKVSLPLKQRVSKQLCLSLVLSKIAGCRLGILFKRGSVRYGCFLVDFAKFLRNPFFIEKLSTTASVFCSGNECWCKRCGPIDANRNCLINGENLNLFTIYLINTMKELTILSTLILHVVIKLAVYCSTR